MAKTKLDDGKHFYQRPSFWPRVIAGLFLLIFVIAFHSEVLILLKVIRTVVVLLATRKLNPLPQNTPQGLVILAGNAVVYAAVYFFILSWISFFVLPSQSGMERQRVNNRLIQYVLGLHGPAVFVKNGKLVARRDEVTVEEEGKARFASMAMVGLDSAIVVESRTRASLLTLPPKVPQKQPIRVLGPGIGFLHSGERIRGAVDLRKQFRQAKGVRGYTSDGIELQTTVSVVFTLGQPSDVITVFQTTDLSLAVMTIDRDTQRITISDKLDQADAEEIKANLKRQRPDQNSGMAPDTGGNSRPPFAYQVEHVISAVISQPRNTRDGKLEQWTDLPARVAVSTLLDQLSCISYDDLYSLDSFESGCALYDSFKPEFRRKVKELGVLAYQFVQRKDGKIPQVGEIFHPEKYHFWPVTELKNTKPIHERGIKIIEAGFSDFIPSDSSVPEQRFDTWRAKQQKQVELSNAEYDLEIIRETNHARAHAQREIIYNLSQIFKYPGYSQDAMAIHIFEALESAASNPATNRLLPRDTLDMLKTFQRLLFTPPSGDQPGLDSSSDEPRRDQ